MQQRPLLHGEGLVGGQVDVAVGARTRVLVAVELAAHVHVALVASQVVGLREAAVTDLTLVRALASVHTLVNLEKNKIITK